MDIKNQTLLGEEAISRLIWKMSVPSIMGVLAYNLYNIVDTIFVSKGVGTDAVGGLSISFPLFIFLSAVSSTLGSGAASVMSRALGNKEYERANKTAGNVFVMFYIIAILVTVFGLIFLDPLLNLMGVTETLLPYAKSYTRIILLGAVTSTGFSNIIRAEGSAKYAMYIWVIPMIINIVLDPIFIFTLNLGVSGAALATVISQCVSMAMSIYYFFISGKSLLRILPKHFIPDLKILSEIVMIGIPSFLQMFGYGISMVIINQILRKYGGDLSISTYGIVSKISTFLVIPMTGMVQGLQPIIGFNYGASKNKRVFETIRKGSHIAFCYGVISYVVIFAFSRQFINIFTPDLEVIQTGNNILKIVNIGVVFSGVLSVQVAYFQAIGKKVLSIFLALCNNIICFIPVMLITSSMWGLIGVWYAFPISNILALLISTILIKQTIKKGMILNQ